MIAFGKENLACMYRVNAAQAVKGKEYIEQPLAARSKRVHARAVKEHVKRRVDDYHMCAFVIRQYHFFLLRMLGEPMHCRPIPLPFNHHLASTYGSLCVGI